MTHGPGPFLSNHPAPGGVLTILTRAGPATGSQTVTYSEFTALVGSVENPVVLLEGRRSIPVKDFKLARDTARFLALEFPALRFRSGNADGADQAFADGVASVDPSRLQVIVPYQGHRKKFRTTGTVYESLESLDRLREEHIAEQTILASPANKRLIDHRQSAGALAAKARYLLRDTMKVLGHSEDFPPPIAALFYVDPANPESGGTGHTIRVCQRAGTPFAFQDDWGSWLD